MPESESPLVPDCSTNDHCPSGNSTSTNGVDIQHHLTTYAESEEWLPGGLPISGSVQHACNLLVDVHGDFPDVGKTMHNVYQRNGYPSSSNNVCSHQQQAGIPGRDAQAIPPRGTSAPYPLSLAQQRLWFLVQLEPQSPLYTIAKALRLQGALNVAALQQALNAIVVRHEVLRTSFALENGGPVQVVAEANRSADFTVIGLDTWPEAEREAELHRLLTKEAQRPFDLSRDLMLRATLLRLDQEDHVLLLCMHQIAFDSGSTDVLLRELADFYAAFALGRVVVHAALPMQYADYAVWQRQWVAGKALAAQRVYWKRQLDGAPPILELPTDHPRPAVQTYSGARHVLIVSKSLRESLEILSQRQGVTLFETLLAAFQVLLHRYAGQDDIVVGTPIAGRHRAETEGLIGPFTNTLVLRTDLSGNPTFQELLARVQKVVSGAYAHRDLPFEQLVEELQPERNVSYTPMFQVTFTCQNAPSQPPEMPGLTLTSLDVQSGTAMFDLTLSIIEAEGGGLQGALTYNTDLFEATAIARMMGHFQTVLVGVAVQPETPIATVPLLTAAEQQQLLAWNATQRPYRREACLHTLFEEQVARTPHAVAAIYDREHLSYEALNQRANQLAHHLRGRGVGPGTLVGLLMERSPEMLVGLLGVLKAGGAYVPLDPAYPSERLSFMARDSQVAVLVTQQHLLPTLPAHQAQVVCLDSDWKTFAHERQDNPEGGAAAEDPAYVIYTSGSTGVPKGVVGLHRGTVNRLQWMWETYPFEAEEVGCQKTALSFVDAVWEIFGPLLQGVPTVIIPDKVLKDPPRLLHTLAEQHVTRIVLVPSLLHVILDTDIDLQRQLPRLKYWTSSGEALSVELCQRFHERLPQSILLNLYGSSEVAADATAYDTRQGESLRCVPIGRPIANTQIYLLDPQMQPVPVGVPGELYIGGDGLAQSYWRRPELTAERFIQNPFGDEPGARLFKTGDLARYLPDGNLEFLGRMDHQVKVRGFRIELGEIETVLDHHAAVRQSVVVVREDQPGDKRLVVYLIANEPRVPSVRELRRLLQERLPDYMIPSTFVWLDALPLTPSGKVARTMLPVPEQTRPLLEAPYVAPQTPLEQFLADAWRDVLQVDRIGIHDNFFELGGDSIRGSILINKVQQALGEFIYIVALFNAPTIDEFVAHLNVHYQDAVARFNGGDTTGGAVGTSKLEPISRVDAAKVAQMHALIRSRPSQEALRDTGTGKNPPAVFILSAPRSGTTLLRVMLAGHPRLFAPPELELLGFQSLEERRKALSGPWSFWLEGTIRAIMELKGCDADQARQIMAACEDRKLTTKQFFRELQAWAENRIIVDKSTTYALDLATLQRAEAYFEHARYIYLARHPHGMIESFQDVRLDRVFFRYDHPFTVRELAELVWVVCHQNIQAFLAQVPESRQYHLRFEDLVTRPQETLMALCAFMGLAFHLDMAMPYKATERRMTDGIHVASRMLGDMKFHQHADIDPTLAESWKMSRARVPLGDITWRMAEELGYARLEEEKSLPGMAQVDDDELARMLDEIEGLSEDEARLHLNHME